ncbi:MAG: hypothetical protein ACK55I_23280, partial [bacterium]
MAMARAGIPGATASNTSGTAASTLARAAAIANASSFGTQRTMATRDVQITPGPAARSEITYSFEYRIVSRSPNARDQRLATLDFPSGPILSRVRCIALLRA